MKMNDFYIESRCAAKKKAVFFLKMSIFFASLSTLDSSVAVWNPGNLEFGKSVDAQMHQDSNVRSLMRFAKLYNLELHLMTKVEHEKHVKRVFSHSDLHRYSQEKAT